MKTILCFAGALLVLALLTLASVRPNSHFQKIKSEIFSYNDDLDTTIELKLGGFSFFLVEKLARFIDKPEIEEARSYIDHLDRVELGVYKSNRPSNNDFSKLYQDLEATMNERGFQLAVKAREDNELVTLFVPQDLNGTINEAFVVVVNKKETVLVKVEADFQRIAKAVVTRHELLTDLNQQLALL